MVKINKRSWMQIIINVQDGYINGILLADQIGMRLNSFLRLDDIKDSSKHIQVLTGQKEKYQGNSSWDNLKGVYLCPFISLELVTMKKQYDFIEEFHG